MADELLRTKLTPPLGRANLVSRDRLHQQLQNGLYGPVTTVIAPAGSGKTSLLRSWRATPAGERLPMAWVALDEDDSDPIRFWRYVAAAMEPFDSEIAKQVIAQLNAGQPLPLESMLTSLINASAHLDSDCALVLDDYHTISNTKVHESLAFFIEHLPPSLHLILASRSDPPLPQARWRARGQLVEIREADLRFDIDEAAQLLAATLDQELTMHQISLLTSRTEGWAAGLHLAGLALQGRDDVTQFVETFSGSHRFVLSYLVEDVMANLADELQTFLMQTAIMDQLSGPLCDAVTGRTDSDEMLAHLATANLFTIPLDETGYWYRYHHLFAEVLRHRIRQVAPDSLPGLHQRAANWYESRGLVVQAVNHALLAQDVNYAVELIAAASDSLLARGEAYLVRRWIEQLPDSVVREHPQLCLTMAWSQLITGPLDSVEPWLSEIDRALAKQTTLKADALRGETAAIRSLVASFMGEISRTIIEAQTALQLLPEENVNLRAVVSMSLGQAHRFDDNVEESSTAYQQAIRFSLEANNLYITMDSMGDLGLVHMKQGRLREADQVFRRSQQLLIEHGVEHLPVAGAINVIWPYLLREFNQLADAIDMVTKGIELGHQGSKMDILITGYRLLGAAKWGLGDYDGALEAIDQSRDYARAYGLEHTARGIDALRAQISLAQGDLATAQLWAAHRGPDSDLPGGVREAEHLMLARVHLTSGDTDAALRLLADMLIAAENDGRMASAIAILAVQSIVYDAQQDQEVALATLSRALQLAAPEGFVRTFLDEGAPMLPLLRRAIANNVEAGYAHVLLTESGEEQAVPHPANTHSARSLTEPLSEREQTVLRLLGVGLSGPEIGNEMYVAASTVRTHLKNIYRKLDVHSRDQAIARARDLGLI